MLWSSGLALRGLKFALICLATPVAGQTAFVTCQPSDSVSVIDVARGKEVARWKVSGKPAGVAVSEGNVFVVAPDAKTVRRFTSEGDLLQERWLDGGPTGVALDDRRDRLFVSDWYNARLWVLRAGTLEVLRTLETGPEPAGIAISPNGHFVASADKGANQVSIFDAETLAMRTRISVGERPYGLGFAADGRLFVGNVGTNDVTVIDPLAEEIQETIAVGERPYGLAFTQKEAFVTNQYANSLSVIDLSTLTAVGDVSVGEYPEGIDATADGSRVVFANWFENTVTVMDAKTRSVIYDIDTCDGPRAFGKFLLGGEE